MKSIHDYIEIIEVVIFTVIANIISFFIEVDITRIGYSVEWILRIFSLIFAIRYTILQTNKIKNHKNEN